MPTNIRSLMDPSLGVQEVLQPETEETHLPRARALTTDVARESRLSDLYRADNLQGRILAGLQPVVGDEALLRPDMLRKNLAQSRAKLSQNRDPHVRRFLREDLEPLMENGQLLSEYVNMLVDG